MKTFDNDFECPKCGYELCDVHFCGENIMTYDGILQGESMSLTCQQCGYAENQRPLDYKEPE